MSNSKRRRRAVTQKTMQQAKPSKGKIAFLHRIGLPLAICLALVVASLVVFWQVRNHEFISFDDYLYITDNPFVKAGLVFKSTIWAFTTMHASNWHPLTWLSHMLDIDFYGLNPAGHHLTNLLFHIANTLLLFLVLKRMTGALWRSSFVAALFALHPLHVESVAWVAERKDVLSTLFCMLTMWTYIWYTEHPKLNRYLLVLLFFALGLLSKPMLVTLPFVLLLLDYWPLGRLQMGLLSDSRNQHSSRAKGPPTQETLIFRLFCEKVPFLVLSAASSFLTFQAQQKGGIVKSFELFPLGSRIANSLVTYVKYIEKMIWPHHMAILYPHPGMVPLWQVIGAGLLLVCVSALAIRSSRKHPYFVVGWLWYLGTLVPVIGLVQVGMQAMADRYTYVPLIGLFIIIAWGIPNIFKGWRYQKIAFGILGGLVLSIFMIITRLQNQYWKDNITLFGHTVDVTENNYIAQHGLGLALVQRGKIEEGIIHFAEALRIKPDYLDVHYNLGLALAHQGKTREAIPHFAEAVRINPNYAEAHNNLGLALALQGDIENAIVHYNEALRIKQNYAEAHNNLGIALIQLGKKKEAITHFIEAVRINPNDGEAHCNLGLALAEQGDLEDAISHYREALRIKAYFPQAHYFLGLAYLMSRDRDSALQEYEILKKMNRNLANTLFQKISK